MNWMRSKATYSKANSSMPNKRRNRAGVRLSPEIGHQNGLERLAECCRGWPFWIGCRSCFRPREGKGNDWLGRDNASVVVGYWGELLAIAKAGNNHEKTMSTTLVNLFTRVVAGVATTNAQYSSLFRPNINTQPLLYWDDPTTARFAILGVNPSAAEFTKETVAELTRRLLGGSVAQHYRSRRPRSGTKPSGGCTRRRRSAGGYSTPGTVDGLVIRTIARSDAGTSWGLACRRHCPVLFMRFQPGRENTLSFHCAAER